LGDIKIPVHIRRHTGDSLGFELLIADIPGLFDREGIYTDPQSGFGYSDETERYIVFQQCALHYIQSLDEKPNVIHCHDHHTGLIPFMVKHCPEFRNLSHIPTIFTIHNGVYHGSFGWSKAWILPWYDADANGLLDWAGNINPLACGIKCCWKLTTVSPGYLLELLASSNGLEWLIRNELPKSQGILNGIDTQVWDPESDPLIENRLYNDISRFKSDNKAVLRKRFDIHADQPLITFIGRLVAEKGADLLPDAIAKFLHEGGKASFVVLGTGDPNLKDAFLTMKHHFTSWFDTSIEYNEALSHQLYAFRYGTIPIVRATGGLADTVTDVSQPNGNGIRFDHFSVDALAASFHRATAVYHHPEAMNQLRAHNMSLDYSWEKAANSYIHIYQSTQHL
jgi:starch synthase